VAHPLEEKREARERQREDALAIANAVRIRRANMKRAIRTGLIDPIRLLNGQEPQWSEALDDTTLDHFLMAIPRFGRTTVDEIIHEFGTNGSLKMGYISIPRRRELAFMIRMVKGEA
jgi:hypothetical protein